MLQRIMDKLQPRKVIPASVPASKGSVANRPIRQNYKGILSKAELESGLAGLQPGTPWAHYYDFGSGIQSVDPSNEKFYRKATGLKTIGESLLDFTLSYLGKEDLSGQTVLDIACGEAGHSIEFASRGASVLGIEGRDLYVERARFAASAFGLQERCKIQKGDVRQITAESKGTFDIVLMLGILHHLDKESFWPMLKELHRLTNRIAYVYTHVSEFDSVPNHQLVGPVSADSYEGYLFQEHEENATAAERTNQVRASLDNTYSFWAREESLLRALKAAGFRAVTKILHPHPFEFPLSQYRVLYGCIK